MVALSLSDAFARQSAYCAGEGTSPVYARLFDEIACVVDDDPVLRAAFADRTWGSDDAIPLRLAGGLHFLALAGDAPDLAALLPSCGGEPDPDRLWPAARSAIAEHPGTIARFLDLAPQTNEVARSALLSPAFAEIARLTGCDLHLLEIGASAGLNLNWDRYAYRYGERRWGESRLTIEAECRGADLPPDGRLAVATRRGCDRAPVDLADPAACRRLEAYVWPDQVERLARLRAAIGIAKKHPPAVDRADADTWLSAQLERRSRDGCTILFHTIVWQYLDAAAQNSIATSIAAAGAAADDGGPFAWLRFEPNADFTRFELTLTIWPTGSTRRLAIAHPHGSWIDWQGAD